MFCRFVLIASTSDNASFLILARYRFAIYRKVAETKERQYNELPKQLCFLAVDGDSNGNCIELPKNVCIFFELLQNLNILKKAGKAFKENGIFSSEQA